MKKVIIITRISAHWEHRRDALCHHDQVLLKALFVANLSIVNQHMTFLSKWGPRRLVFNVPQITERLLAGAWPPMTNPTWGPPNGPHYTVTGPQGSVICMQEPIKIYCVSNIKPSHLEATNWSLYLWKEAASRFVPRINVHCILLRIKGTASMRYTIYHKPKYFSEIVFLHPLVVDIFVSNVRASVNRLHPSNSNNDTAIWRCHCYMLFLNDFHPSYGKPLLIYIIPSNGIAFKVFWDKSIPSP